MNTTDTTQVCRKCNKEKSLSEFHKRGTSHQRICKSCRKAHTPSGKSRVIILNTPDLQQQMLERIKPIENKIRAKAMSLSNDLLEADDIYSAMIEEVLFKCQPQDSDARIFTRAKWAGYAIIRRQRVYAMLVEDESSMTSSDDDGFSELTIFPTQSAEDELIQHEQRREIMKIISKLPKEQQVIISFLSLGYNQREISRELNKSDQAVSTTIKKIAAQLTNFGLSPAFAS